MPVLVNVQYSDLVSIDERERERDIPRRTSALASHSRGMSACFKWSLPMGIWKDRVFFVSHDESDVVQYASRRKEK